jgi:hypothetical protein
MLAKAELASGAVGSIASCRRRASATGGFARPRRPRKSRGGRCFTDAEPELSGVCQTNLFNPTAIAKSINVRRSVQRGEGSE